MVQFLGEFAFKGVQGLGTFHFTFMNNLTWMSLYLTLKKISECISIVTCNSIMRNAWQSLDKYLCRSLQPPWNWSWPCAAV